MTDRHDIRDRADIADLVTAFYTRAFADPVLGPIFTDIAHMDLDAHMPIMCDFWETVLFQAGKYGRNAFSVHLDLHRLEPLTPMHFQRWLDIWEGTVDDLFAGPKANLAKVQAGRIAGSISRRLERTVDGELLTLLPRRA
jgi:hemoglobin